MPSASPAGTHPALTSRAKSCPDRPQVKGTCGPAGAPAARTAVPMAVNSSSPKMNGVRDSRSPTTPWPPRAAHSAVIRSRAVRRAWYMASTSGPNPSGSPRPAALAVPGQPDALAAPAA
jgi:hypothetical protein